eukprot:scaffold166525_cov17-Tisochrysis_lutea.AAC.1
MAPHFAFEACTFIAPGGNCVGPPACHLWPCLPSLALLLANGPTHHQWPSSSTRCAAPGGKATMLAQLMKDQGVVVALDRSQAKASQVMSLANELGLTIIQAFKMDATRAVLPEETSSRGKQQQQQQQQD